MCMYLHESMPYVCRCWQSDGSIGCSGVLVTGVFEPHDMVAGN